MKTDAINHNDIRVNISNPSPDQTDKIEQSLEVEPDESTTTTKRGHHGKLCMCIDMKYGVPVIGLFIVVDLAVSIINLLLFIFRPSQKSIHATSVVARVEFSVLYGISKLLMVCAPVPFISTICGCAQDSYKRRKMLYKAILFNVVPTTLMTIVVLIVAYCLSWIRFNMFLISAIAQILYFFLYVYLIGILKRHAEAKKVEDDMEVVKQIQRSNSIVVADEESHDPAQIAKIEA